MTTYLITAPTTTKVPILVSVPHCGTAFPDELRDSYDPALSEAPDDTDWFVDKLYDFVAEMGITVISAHYSRWVIDLNRDPENKSLYDDGRIITSLCPTTDFHGNKLYVGNEPDQTEINRRVKRFYEPYHDKVHELLNKMKSEFGHALLWDAHSIREYVPTIRKEKFPDLILGSVDEQSAGHDLIKTALGGLAGGTYTLEHNHPFKGGQITRSFGKPEANLHALQLEMSKKLYMDDTETIFNEVRANRVRVILKETLSKLIDKLKLTHA